jgi:hypothetical protein
VAVAARRAARDVAGRVVSRIWNLVSRLYVLGEAIQAGDCEYALGVLHDLTREAERAELERERDDDEAAA